MKLAKNQADLQSADEVPKRLRKMWSPGWKCWLSMIEVFTGLKPKALQSTDVLKNFSDSFLFANSKKKQLHTHGSWKSWRLCLPLED